MNERLTELFNLFNKRIKHKSENLKKVHKGRIEGYYDYVKSYTINDVLSKLQHNGILEKVLSHKDKCEINDYIKKLNNAKHSLIILLNEFEKRYPNWDEDRDQNDFSNSADNWIYMDKTFYNKLERTSIIVSDIQNEENDIITKIATRVLKNNSNYKNKVPIEVSYLDCKYLSDSDKYYNELKNITIETFPKITAYNPTNGILSFKLKLDSNKDFERIRKMYLFKYIANAKMLNKLIKETRNKAIRINDFEVLVDKTNKDKIIKMSDLLIDIVLDFETSIAKLDKRSVGSKSFSFF